MRNSHVWAGAVGGGASISQWKWTSSPLPLPLPTSHLPTTSTPTSLVYTLFLREIRKWQQRPLSSPAVLGRLIKSQKKLCDLNIPYKGDLDPLIYENRD